MTAKRFKTAFFVLAAAALVALLAGCGGLFGGSSDDSGEDTIVGYGPYTATGPYGGSITVEGVPEGIRITKINPPEADTIMVCFWEAGTDTSVVYESYNRVFYRETGLEEPEINRTEQNDFIYPFVRKDAVYNIDLITWGVDSNGTWVREVHSDIIQVRAGGGQGDLRTIIYDSGYDKDHGKLWFDLKEERPDKLTGKFYYNITLRPENLDISIGTPWMERDNAKTQITSLPTAYDEFGQPVEEVPLKEIATLGGPFRVDYGFMYWVSPNEIYQGNIMTAQKKLFNAN